jgi:hypothetical protein
MEHHANRQTRLQVSPALPDAWGADPDVFFESLAVEDEGCCCGKPNTDSTRCGCDGDPESIADCCCAGL